MLLFIIDVRFEWNYLFFALIYGFMVYHSIKIIWDNSKGPSGYGGSTLTDLVNIGIVLINLLFVAAWGGIFWW